LRAEKEKAARTAERDQFLKYGNKGLPTEFDKLMDRLLGNWMAKSEWPPESNSTAAI
jgi:hypothetical protein